MITFFRLVDDGIPPEAASKSAIGTLPTDGYRYCEPLRTASSLGWYVYLPFDLWLVWDGSEIQWSIDEGDNWYPLAGAVQYPGFAGRFDEHAPERCAGYAPPFLTMSSEHNVLQIWTGTLARTEPGVFSLVRAPANLFWRTDFSVLEGVVETDEWFGPLFTNIRLRRMDAPIILRSEQPFIQVQPVSAAIVDRLGEEGPQVLEGLEALTDEDWTRYASTVVRRMQTRERLGDYAVESRRRHKHRAKAAPVGSQGRPAHGMVQPEE